MIGTDAVFVESFFVDLGSAGRYLAFALGLSQVGIFGKGRYKTVCFLTFIVMDGGSGTDVSLSSSNGTSRILSEV